MSTSAKTSSRDAYDKSPFRSIKHSTYFPVYDQLLSPYQNRDITFVEVGVFEGGSLFMWREFFGPRARIIGIDFNPEAKKWEADGFEIFVGSQSSPDFWDEFFSEVGAVDILLDDGGHTYTQQIITTEMGLDHIKDGGMLIVEDTHTSYLDGFGDKSISFINYCKRWIDRVNSRFGSFVKEQKDRRVWSVEVFESIVAFKVNRAFSQQVSMPTDNGGKRDFSKDFRNADRKLVERDSARIERIIKRGFDIFGGNA
ncbi:class I SAM-dependent methyltransferase [Spiribacter insolitus]|uniref:Class I SAM-dependent methyltransferase n=1 Tax=Spiribacter insolitus TaxID=3122417 RepID=A0ABV3T568_9GAMM